MVGQSAAAKKKHIPLLIIIAEDRLRPRMLASEGKAKMDEAPAFAGDCLQDVIKLHN
jgi:hypothetical protein